MKKELNKKIISICEEAGTAAAVEKCAELMDELDGEYDSRVAAGMTELEAYREVSHRLDEIRKLVNSLPDDEEESEAETADRAAGFLTLKRIAGKMSTVLWLATVPVYFLYSLATGRWATSWLIFLLSSITEIVINTTVDLNNVKKDRKKVIRGAVSSILWLAAVIVYFLVSFSTGAWSVSWMIFILAAIIQQFFEK